MSIYEVLTIIFGLVLLLAGISWATIIATWKNLIKDTKELLYTYDKAQADHIIDDTEKAQIADKAIPVLKGFLDLWQQGVNIFYQIKKIILRK